MMPTPTVYGNYNAPGSSRKAGIGLSTYVKLWPTPRANEGKDVLQSVPPSRQKEPGKCNLTEAVAMEMLATPCAIQIGGQLNPAWVEALMGFPVGWTALEE